MRSYDEEAVFHASKAEEELNRDDFNLPASTWANIFAKAQVHATLAVAYSQIGAQTVYLDEHAEYTGPR